MKKSIRKIIHIDMDSFYASVKQMDDPTFKGKPISVGDRRPIWSVFCFIIDG